jgi:hypothetical protein
MFNILPAVVLLSLQHIVLHPANNLISIRDNTIGSRINIHSKIYMHVKKNPEVKRGLKSRKQIDGLSKAHRLEYIDIFADLQTYMYFVHCRLSLRTVPNGAAQTPPRCRVRRV